MQFLASSDTESINNGVDSLNNYTYAISKLVWSVSDVIIAFCSIDPFMCQCNNY